MLDLICLGTGANSFNGLSTVSFALRGDSSTTLVDCGPDIARQAKLRGIDLGDVATVVITHRHLDHSLGLPYFLMGRELDIRARHEGAARTGKPLTVIAEDEVWRVLSNLFEFCQPGQALHYTIETVAIAELVGSPRLLADDLSLETIPGIHAVPAYGVVFREGEVKVFAYSSDSVPSRSFREAAESTLVVVHEAMVSDTEVAFASDKQHSTASQAGTVLSGTAKRHALITHIRPEYWATREKLEMEASVAAGHEVRYVREGEVIQLVP